MPLAHTPCCRLPELQPLKRDKISSQRAAQKLREFHQQEALHKVEDAAAVVTSGHAQLSYSQLEGIIERLENDWVGHPEEHLLDCFIEVEARTEIHMHPCYLGSRLKEGLRKAAGEILLKYQRALGCIPLTMADLKPEGSRHGAIVQDTPYVHFLAKFRAVGFAPQKSHWLLGRVNQEQPTPAGMNMRILNLVNVWVPRDSLPTELKYDRSLRAWLKGEKQLTEKHIALLRVESVNTSVRHTGDMGIELRGLVETAGHFKGKRQKPKLEGDAASPGPSTIADTPMSKLAPVETPKSKRKSREMNGDGQNGEEVNHVADEDGHKKKKKRKKEVDSDA